MNKIRGLNILGRILFIILFIISAAVFWFTKSGEGWTDFILNGIFEILSIIFIIVYFAGAARPMAKMEKALNKATDNIRTNAAASTPKELWAELSGNEALFAESVFAKPYASYVKKVRREIKQNPNTSSTDISDYLDEALVEGNYKKTFCDQVGGIFTGLGILFTFIGLVYGLRNFNATSVELMQTSTQTLMAGIKVAFLTSICGLVYSLVYGLMYRRVQRIVMKSLYDFQDTYNECVRPINEHAAENTLIRLTTEQNELLNALASNIGSSVAESLSESIKPVVSELRDTLERYVAVAIEDQRAGLDRVVTYFVSHVDESMGNIFTQLRGQTEEMTAWQMNMVKSCKMLVETLGESEKTLQAAIGNSQTVVDCVSVFTENSANLSVKQKQALDSIQGYIREYQEMHQVEKTYIVGMADAVRTMQNSAEETAGKTASISEQVDGLSRGWIQAAADTNAQLSASGEKIIEAADNMRKVSESSSDAMNRAGEKLAGAFEGSFTRFDKQLDSLNAALMHLANMTNEISSSMKNIPQAASSFDTDVNKSIRSLKAELATLLGALIDTRKALEKFNNGANRKLDL